MIKDNIANYLKEIHYLYEHLRRERNIHVFTYFDDSCNWDQQEIDCNLINTINGCFLYILTQLSPGNCNISHTLTINGEDRRKVSIIFSSNAYLGLIFNKRNPLSVKKLN